MLRRRPIMRAAVGTAVVAGTATAVSGRVQHRQARRYQTEAEAQAYEQQQYAAPVAEAPPAPPPAATPTMTPVEQLKELAALHADGVLTDAEFDAEKARILAS